MGHDCGEMLCDLFRIEWFQTHHIGTECLGDVHTVDPSQALLA
jgi:hypothetical protein